MKFSKLLVQICYWPLKVKTYEYYVCLLRLIAKNTEPKVINKTLDPH